VVLSQAPLQLVTLINLCRLGEIQIYKLRQHQKFKHLFKEVAERNAVDENDISVDMYYNFIGPDDTPHSIGLKSFHTLSRYPLYTIFFILLSKYHF